MTALVVVAQRYLAGHIGASLVQGHPSAMARKTILFLCTGNYYRSRYAEELFNHLAQRECPEWHATSRALALERGKDNVGPMARSTFDALMAAGIEPVGAQRWPEACDIEALQTSDMVIAVKEAEHRALLAERFPGWADRVTYWHVHDIDAAHPDDALAELTVHVTALARELRR